MINYLIKNAENYNLDIIDESNIHSRIEISFEDKVRLFCGTYDLSNVRTLIYNTETHDLRVCDDDEYDLACIYDMNDIQLIFSNKHLYYEKEENNHINNKTYKELYKKDVLKVKEWINNCTPFDFHKENGDTWEFGGYYITDAISDFVDPILNPNLLWDIAQEEIDKLYDNLYHENHWSNRFETNIGTIHATYCFVGQDEIIFYDKNHKEVTSLDKGIIDFVKNNDRIIWRHDTK